MHQAYIQKKFNQKSLDLITTIDEICDDYKAQGFVLTVRQLYYQLVARNIIENTERSYKNTTSLVNDARLAGLVDWSAIEDRTRSFIQQSSWTDGENFMLSVAPQFHADMWEGQENRVFVIVEKEALVGVLEGVCEEHDVPLLAARGYPSVSVLRDFARDKIIPTLGEQRTKILHLGDHDPSGIDMSRDLEDRLKLLCGDEGRFVIERIALNMDQVKENKCPPNPAKITDSRCPAYIKRFGRSSWELDALEPSYLVKLVRGEIEKCIDFVEWSARREFIRETRHKLIDLANNFNQ